MEAFVRQSCGAWLPRQITFPGIKDEVLDDSEAEDVDGVVWWGDLKPDKRELAFVAVKDEVLAHDYQAGAQPFMEQDLLASKTGSGGDERDSCDELLESQSRHINKFIIDFEPEEWDVSQYSHIVCDPKGAGASTETCDGSFIYGSCTSDSKQDDTDNTMIPPDLGVTLKCTSGIPAPTSMIDNSTEDVIIIDDDDDDSGDYPTIKYKGCDLTTGVGNSDNYETIVIDDDDDCVNNECQQEKDEIKTDCNAVESPVRIPENAKRKRKKKQSSAQVKCIVVFDGYETKRIPLVSNSKTTDAAKNDTGIDVPHTTVHGDNPTQSTVSKKCETPTQKTNSKTGDNLEKVAADDQNECFVNTIKKSIHLTERPDKVKYSMEVQKYRSKLMLNQEEFKKSMQEFKQCDSSAQEEKQCDSSAHEEKQCDSSAQEEKQCGSSAQEEKQCDSSVQEEKQCDSSVQEDKQCDSSAQEEKQCDSSAQEAKQCDSSAQEEKQCNSSAQGMKQNSMSLMQDLHQLSNTQNHCQANQPCKSQKSDHSLHELQNCIAPLQKSQEFIKFMDILHKFIENVCGLNQHGKTNLVSNQHVQFVNTCQEYVVSRESILECADSIKALKNCIASLQKLQANTELGNTIQHSGTSVELLQDAARSKDLQYCEQLLKKLKNCYRYLKQLHLRKSTPLEPQQMQPAVGNTRQHTRADIDSADYEESIINSQHTNQCTDSKLIKNMTVNSMQVDQNSLNYYPSNSSVIDQEQMDQAAENLESILFSFQDSQQSNNGLVLNSIVDHTLPVKSKFVTCKLCRKKLKTHAGLKIHIKRKHSEMTCRFCSECQQDFHTLDLLKNHYESHHSELVSKFISRHILPTKKLRKKFLNPANIRYRRACSFVENNIRQQMHSDYKKYQSKPGTAPNETHMNTDKLLVQPSISHFLSRSVSLQEIPTTSRARPIPAPLQQCPKSSNVIPTQYRPNPMTSQSIPATAPLQSHPTFLHSRSGPLKQSHTTYRSKPVPAPAPPQRSATSNVRPPLQQSRTSSYSRPIPATLRPHPTWSRSRPIPFWLNYSASDLKTAQLQSSLTSSHSRQASLQRNPTSLHSRLVSLQQSHTDSCPRLSPLQQSNTDSYPRPSSLQQSPTSSHSRPAPALQQTHPTSSHSRPASLKLKPSSNLNTAPLLSSLISSHLRPAPLQQSPVWSNPAPLLSKSSSLQSAHGPLHSISASYSRPALESINAHLFDKTMHVEKENQARNDSFQRALKEELIKRVIALSRAKYKLMSVLMKNNGDGQQTTGLERCLNEGKVCNSEKGTTARTVISKSTEGVWQRDPTISHGRDLFTSERGKGNSTRCNTNCGVPRNGFSVTVSVQGDDSRQNINDHSCTSDINLRQSFCRETNRSSCGMNHTTNYGPSSSSNFPVHTKPQVCGQSHCDLSPCSDPSNDPNPTQQLSVDVVHGADNLQPGYHNKCNCRLAPLSGPCCTKPSLSNIPGMAFAENLAQCRQIPADMMGHEQQCIVYNHDQGNPASSNMYMCNDQVLQPAAAPTKQPVIVANYNSVTYVQNSVPCVV